MLPARQTLTVNGSRHAAIVTLPGKYIAEACAAAGHCGISNIAVCGIGRRKRLGVHIDRPRTGNKIFLTSD
jgi:hypothetical protein